MPKKGFELQFKNPVQDSGDALTNVVFINDTPSESDILRLELTTVPDVTLTLKPVDSDQVSDSNYHFKLTCRPDTLALPEQILLDASHSAQWGMVCIPETAAASPSDGERAPGDIDFYVLYKGDSDLAVSPDAPVSLTLRKVGAASSGGTRPTITQVTLNKKETDFDKFVVLAGPGGDYNLTESTGLVLIAPRGQSAPTLMAGFASSDIVLNDGDTESYLLLRIVNTGLLPISLAPEGSASPTKLTLRFEADDTTSRPWALATRSQVSSILIPGKPDSSATDPNWSGKDAWTVAAQASERTWTLTPKAGKTSLAPDEAIEVPISKIVTGHATGRTPLRIRYAGLPGFDEGELVAYIQKYPLVYADRMVFPGTPSEKRLNWVGIGTNSPFAKLTVETAANAYGIVHTDGTIVLSTALFDGVASLGTPSGHPLGLYTGETQIRLTSNGKVGIGTTEPSERLTVQTTEPATAFGITHTHGTVKVSTRIDETSGHLGTQSNHPLHLFTSGGAPQVTLKTNGNLGIGTDNPSAKLTVRTGQYDGIVHTDGTVQLATRVTGSAARLGTLDAHPMSFFTEGKDRMTLTTDGKLVVGRSEDSDTEKLHVKGDLRVDRDFKKGQGPFVFWANRDKVANADLLKLMDKDDNEALKVHGDGRLWLKTKPFDFQHYHVRSDNLNIQTDRHSDAWLAALAGFWVDHTEDEPTNIYVWPYVASDKKWWIRCDIGNARETNWWVSMIFIRRDIISLTGSLPPP